MRHQKAYVKTSTRKPNIIPRWLGGRLPFSPSLSILVRKELELAHERIFDSQEMQAIKPILLKQNEISTIPTSTETLFEIIRSKEGHYPFIYPFGGRMVHEGLASILALRLSRVQGVTFSMSVNDYKLQTSFAV